jgi:small-conductance mechanosensitive channel
MGYLRVARLLVSGVLAGGVLALTLSASVRIVRAVIAFGLRLRPLRLLGMVQRHRDLLERRAQRILILMAVIAWSVRVLDYVGMFQPAVSLGKAVLAAKLERGSISLSLGDVLAFVLTVWAAYLLSSFTRFFLEEDVYPRRKVPQGFAYAASRLIHYLLMAVGFLLGLGILGMDLTRVTVLLGAFGVGIGFGLQSVVNNFVSGLILLFERPIHAGDMVEIGSLLGRVHRIGIRASIVRTRQGSEIIVPNSQLISEQVTNWTYSDRTRRIEMPIGVNYGAAPREVIAVIEAAAADNASVLNHPRPHAIFVGFGDSSLDFELRAWTERFEDWCQVKSELGMAVYDALLAAGFSIPFPQREVRLLKDNTA